MDAKQFEALSKRLDAIVLLLSLDILKGKKKTDSILYLHEKGVDNTSIAFIVGTTAEAVASRIYEANKAGGKKTKAKQPKAKKVVEVQPEGDTL